MTPTSTTLTRHAPVPVTIGLRPPAEAAGTLPAPIPTPPVPEGAFQIIGDLNIDVAESAGAAARLATTSPTRPGLHSGTLPRPYAGRGSPRSSRNRAVSMIRRQFPRPPCGSASGHRRQGGPRPRRPHRRGRVELGYRRVPRHGSRSGIRMFSLFQNEVGHSPWPPQCERQPQRPGRGRRRTARQRRRYPAHVRPVGRLNDDGERAGVVILDAASQLCSRGTVSVMAPMRWRTAWLVRRSRPRRSAPRFWSRLTCVPAVEVKADRSFR